MSPLMFLKKSQESIKNCAQICKDTKFENQTSEISGKTLIEIFLKLYTFTVPQQCIICYCFLCLIL